jgi:hypothetical protein
MPLVGIAWGARTLNWTQAKSEYEAGSLPYPTPLLRAMQDSRDDSVPTASVMASCMRQFQLKASTPYYERPSELLPSVFGTAFHALMEKYTEYDPGHEHFPDDIHGPDIPAVKAGPRHKELDLQARVTLTGHGVVTVKGRCDYLHEGHLVRDWKSKKFLGQNHTPPEDNIHQVNVYNWLAYENGMVPAPVYELVYVSQSWLANFKGPTDNVDEVRAWVQERLAVWAKHEALGTLVPPLPQLFQPVDPKTHRLPMPCGYCPVREACMKAYKEELGLTEGEFDEVEEWHNV